METFRLEVGLAHNVKPGNIVGAIANEAGIEGRHIGRIRLYEDYSTVDLPEGMPADIFNGLKKTRVAGRPLNITRLDESKTRGDYVTSPASRPASPAGSARAVVHGRPRHAADRVAGRPLNISRVGEARAVEGVEEQAVVRHRSVENPAGTGKKNKRKNKFKKPKPE